MEHGQKISRQAVTDATRSALGRSAFPFEGEDAGTVWVTNTEGIEPGVFEITLSDSQRFRIQVQEIEGEQVDGQLALFDRDLNITEEART